MLDIVDVLITVRALKARAILITGNWKQAKFYINLATRNLKLASDRK